LVFSDFPILDFEKILVDEKNNFGVTREFTAGYGIALLRIPTLYVPECASPCERPTIKCLFRGQVDDPATSRRTFPPRCACAMASLMEERG
jgi:hypothetical protein